MKGPKGWDRATTQLAGAAVLVFLNAEANRFRAAAVLRRDVGCDVAVKEGRLVCTGWDVVALRDEIATVLAAAA